MQRRVDVSLVTEARALEHARHEPVTAIIERKASVLGGRAYGYAAIGVRPAARVVDEVDAARAAHEVECGQGERKKDCQQNVNLPQAMEAGEDLVGSELRGFTKKDEDHGRCGDKEEEIVHHDLEQVFEMGW